MSFGEFISRVQAFINRKVTHFFQRQHDVKNPTFMDDFPNGELTSYIENFSITHLEIPLNQIRDVTNNYINHRFDLLGSGWVNVSYGQKYLGLEGHKYDYTKTEVGITNRINKSNVHHSFKVSELIDRAYIPIDWQVDFKSGYRWSDSCWSQNVAIGHLPGVDIKVPWELARLQHLPQIAIAYSLSKNKNKNKNKNNNKILMDSEVYLNEFCNVVLDFIANNPPRYGVNWRSSMDVGIRAVNILVAYDIFQDAGAKFIIPLKDILVQSMFEHGHFIIDNFGWSLHHRGNHYLSHVTSLLFISAYLPINTVTNSWLALSIQELINEFKSQFNEDGSNFEGSTAYHRLSGEMIVYATALVLGLPKEKKQALNNFDHTLIKQFSKLKPNYLSGQESSDMSQHWQFSDWYLERLSKVAHFTKDIIKPSGDIVQIGDNDSGRFIKLCPNFDFMSYSQDKTRYKKQDETTYSNDWWDENLLDHRQLISAISAIVPSKSFFEFQNSGFEHEFIKNLSKGNCFNISDNIESVEVLDVSIDRLMNEIIPNSHSYHFKLPYLQGNLLDRLETFAYPDFGIYGFKATNFFLLIRSGSIGINGNGGHSHNDQLSIELEIDGKGIFVDPGSNLYTPFPKIRNLYRSDFAHFSFSSPVQQSTDINQGLFEVNSDPNGKCLLFQKFSFTGVHDGFGVKVVRTIEIKSDAINIIDYVEKGKNSDQIKPFYDKLLIEPRLAKTTGYGKVLK
jgi:hypothetical protein